MDSLRKMIIDKYPDFFKNIDVNLKIFAREIRNELRQEGHVVIGITGYPGTGKSSVAALLGALIDYDYSFDKNICYIPTSNQIGEQYMSLPMYSFLHIDEASRGLHKHQWQDKVQQKINELYDVEREGHFLCTALIMPRFQNFTENFRNFMITYWINIDKKGLPMFYKKDSDKDAKDPWHIDENYKIKLRKFRGKRVFERTTSDKIRAEQMTDCYWFYSEVPAIPKDIWEEYQKLKKDSRIKSQEGSTDMESYMDRKQREKLDRWNKIIKYKAEGKTHLQIAALMNLCVDTVRRNVKAIEAYNEVKGADKTTAKEGNTIIFNQSNNDKKIENNEGFNNR